MATIPLLALIFLFTFSTVMVQGINTNLNTYIVHVKKPEPAGGLLAEYSADELTTYHRSFLPTHHLASSDHDERPRLLYSYSNVVSGFAARLAEEDVEAMKNKDGFVFAHRERILSLQTTHTPRFLGLRQELGFLKDSNFGKGMIIGVLDSGIFPDHPSFSDAGMPPPPARWKGKCEFNASSCNNKLIGARSFNLAAKANGSKSESPIDENGHGTHTASTAAGAFVRNAAALGEAKGTAVGMAPYAHLSIYKVCSGDGCPDSDILAGLEAAVADGVDVISISIGDQNIVTNVPFFEDVTAIGSFAAMQKGIFVSCSAGNSGPFNGSVKNVAPWVLTVGASTIDRKIVATAKLGNQLEYDGESLFQPENFTVELLPLIYAGSGGGDAFCGEGSLKGIDVKGKIVLCERGGRTGNIDKGKEVLNVGGAAMILINDELNAFSTIADAHVLPATHVSHAAGLKIKAYINSTTTPVATILFKGTKIGDSSAPSVASFSSRGPSPVSPGILKPDIIGPGVSIIAAWALPLDGNTNTNAFFNAESGTSMSCPHLSGIAALLKSAHPYWSPAAIKSAIMTSADLVNHEGHQIVDERLLPANYFATGAGHVNPTKANDPGLIYDIHPNDYVPYLCGLGYTDDQVSILTHKRTKCTSRITEGELNYPSFAVTLGPFGPTQTFTRKVTNVGEAYSSFFAVGVAPKGAFVTVNPDRLFFSGLNQIATYSVTFSRSNTSATTEPSQGYIAWVSGKHVVRSVISVQFN